MISVFEEDGLSSVNTSQGEQESSCMCVMCDVGCVNATYCSAALLLSTVYSTVVTDQMWCARYTYAL